MVRHPVELEAMGDDDVLGTLNFIAPRCRVAAVREVTAGVSVSCAWDIGAEPMTAPFTPQRWMLPTGLGHESSSVTAAGRRLVDSLASASKFISMVCHGRTITHVDALSRMFWRGQMYPARCRGSRAGQPHLRPRP